MLTCKPIKLYTGQNYTLVAWIDLAKCPWDFMHFQDQSQRDNHKLDFFLSYNKFVNSKSKTTSIYIVKPCTQGYEFHVSIFVAENLKKQDFIKWKQC